jgi:FkbM family methyltransferase
MPQRHRARLGSIWARTILKLEIYRRGRNREVTLDGCCFDLRGLPNSAMKLELLTGRYEQPERDAVRRYIRPEWQVVELGGCIGVVSCITNKLLNHPELHVVVEANPLSIRFLENNAAANQCSFKVLNRALAYGKDAVTFIPTTDFWGNSIDQTGGRDAAVTVPATSLAQVLREERFETFALICDIEGYEYDLVTHEEEALKKAALIILELHPHRLGEDKVRSLLSKLTQLGFTTLDRSGSVVVLSKTGQDSSA